MSDSPSTIDAQAFAARRREAKGSDRFTGLIVLGLMFFALVLSGSRLWKVATGELPARPDLPAPAFKGALLHGGQQSLESLKGQVVLLDFWATWCPPCVASLPGLQKVHQDYADRGFTVLGINQEPGVESKVRAFLEARQVTFPSVVDTGNTASIAEKYGVHTFPTSFLIDRDGIIRHSYRGPPRHSTLVKDIEAVLAQPRSKKAPPGDASSTSGSH